MFLIKIVITPGVLSQLVGIMPGLLQAYPPVASPPELSAFLEHFINTFVILHDSVLPQYLLQSFFAYFFL